MTRSRTPIGNLTRQPKSRTDLSHALASVTISTRRRRRNQLRDAPRMAQEADVVEGADNKVCLIEQFGYKAS